MEHIVDEHVSLSRTSETEASGEYVEGHPLNNKRQSGPLKPTSISAPIHDLPQEIRQYVFELALEASTPRPRIFSKKFSWVTSWMNFPERRESLEEAWGLAERTLGGNTLRSLASVCQQWRREMEWVCACRVRETEMWSRTEYFEILGPETVNWWVTRGETQWAKRLQIILAYEAKRRTTRYRDRNQDQLPDVVA
ncbi:hypothetical protein NA57DRAFT_73624 [Rhizodiscina lignyota]|uniref:Uncharacterized protein n=1 Tax=Rhizodiscina lignyota TaxID=1504668 RepID=A0A9P4MC89_9PEZI|nr:hypothetical protein NA57DRAFT_73624 [Rhizodiscina lignyota]